MIRLAKQEDLRRLIEMSERFYPYTTYSIKSRIPLDVEATALLASTMIDHHVVYVAEVNERVVGMIGIIVAPFIFNPAYTHGGEIIWWVEPENNSEGLGRQLLRAIEPRCKELGVTYIQMVDLECSPVKAEELFRSEGYELTERTFTKVI